MFQIIERPKLYEQVVERIKDMIVRGIYKKGDLLPSEKELIEMTGVSRITVREALRLLNEAGVIETRRGKSKAFTKNISRFFIRSFGGKHRKKESGKRSGKRQVKDCGEGKRGTKAAGGGDAAVF